MLRKILRVAVIISVLAMPMFAPSHAGAAPETQWDYDSYGSCTYRGIHLNNLYNYPLAITNRVSGTCTYKYVQLISTHDFSYFYNSDGYSGTSDDAVIAGPHEAFPLNSGHRVCTSSCDSWWYYH
jgi:hypothetical protein